jgi:hypothetical protein
MRLRSARSDQPVADAARERQVGDPVAMQMAELTPAEKELDAAKPMPASLHTGPRTHDLGDPLRCTSVRFVHQLAPVLDLSLSVRRATARAKARVSERAPRRVDQGRSV